MSLYDKAAVAFFAKGAAGKDRVAYNAKPVEKLGEEKITNGGFDTDTDWTKEDAFTISNGKAVSDGTLEQPDIYQNVAVFAGRKMQVSFTVSDYEKGTVAGIFYGFSGGISSVTTAVSGNGSFSFIVDSVTDDANGNIGIRGYSYFKGKIDNFSVKEVIEQARDFEFTRGSNITATRIGPDGKIKKGRENLLLYSNKFDETGTWGSSATMTGGQAGYDGKNNAWKMEAPNDYGSLTQTFSSPYPSGVQTFSVFAKAGNNDGLVIRVDPQDDNPLIMEFYADLSDGTFANDEAGPQVYPRIFNQITDVGGGWYRLQLTFDEPIDTIKLVLSTTTSPLATDVGAGQHVYIQDAQLENSIVPTEPIETFGSTRQAGLQEREPRFNYHDFANDGYPALLMEEARTNRVARSEYFDDYGTNITVNDVVQTSASIEQNEAISPEGLMNASKLKEDTDNTNHKMYAGVGDNFTQGDFYSFSIFAKADGRSKFKMQAGDVSKINYNATFTLSGDGSVSNAGSGSARIQNYGGGWYRCMIENVESLTGVDTKNNIFLIHDTDGQNYTGDGTSGILFYGYQVEEGAMATSYIPTYGSTATRTADLATLEDVNEFVKGNAYTILFDFDATENKLENSIIFSIKDPNGENSFSCRWHNEEQTVRVYNDTDKHYPTTKRISTTNKWLLRINENKFDWFYHFGGSPQKDEASVFTPREMGKFQINGRTCHVNQVLIFDHALPDEDCNSLIS